MENQQCRLVHTGNSTRTDTGTEKSLRNQYIARTYSVKTGSPRHPATALRAIRRRRISREWIDFGWLIWDSDCDPSMQK